MGYAGYSPGANSKVADKLSPLQQALRSLPLDKALETLELLDKITRNVVRNPDESKFRSLKMTNAKIAAAIADAPAMLQAMQEMGWVVDADQMTLPPTVRLSHEVHVVGLIDAKDYFKKEAEDERRRQCRASKSVDAGKENLLKQMDLDRKEKDAEGPVTRGSVATKLGSGPNIMRAADIGIGKSGGG